MRERRSGWWVSRGEGEMQMWVLPEEVRVWQALGARDVGVDRNETEVVRGEIWANGVIGTDKASTEKGSVVKGRVKT